MTIKRHKQLILLTSIFVAISITLTVLAGASVFGRQTEVIFFDIGQGDGILIKTRNQQNILIDAGPDNRVLDRLGRNLSFFDKKLDLVIATHPDKDHIGGLAGVLDRYAVDLFLEPGIEHNSQTYQNLGQVLATGNTPVAYASSRLVYELGENLFLDILHPDKNLTGLDLPDNNAASVVAKLTDGQVDFLFTADATLDVESELIAKYGDYLDSEVLKIGHHGSNTSSSQEFLEAVKPEVAVIQVGKDNQYGHPNFRVIKRLTDLGISILRNDEMGDVKLVSDGEYVELK